MSHPALKNVVMFPAPQSLPLAEQSILSGLADFSLAISKATTLHEAEEVRHHLKALHRAMDAIYIRAIERVDALASQS